MKILITGNLGYIGPTLTRHLRKVKPDATLVGLDQGFFAHCLSGPQKLPETRLDQQWFADVRRIQPHHLQGFDAVVHLAAISNDPMGHTFERVTHEINCRSSIEIARMAKEAGVRHYVFASSCSVYGAADGAPRQEEDPLNPLTAYAKSKIGTEEGIRGLADAEFVITCLRFATACGFSDRTRLDLVLNDFVAGAVACGEINILSDGSPWRPLIHIEDMARAIEWAIDRPAANGGDFLAINAGSDQWNYQVKDLAEAVAKVVPGTRITINSDAAPDKRSYRVDFNRFRELAPHHQPQVSLAEAVEGLKDGLEQIGFSDRDFRNSDFIRLKVLNEHMAQKRVDVDLNWLN
ncbi:NAD-dependent epimerase/dehydratase family protein [Microbulbifer marinus]|uniref:Nucleoside-diphosphate-sugar epimerase n=1 Tax=Microbulbifer marinus TaxID=658218 RepID=A0A1H3VY75_9GAMM|nr:SDR family oxidoreductase [Microbulbifer marinus]SDZ79773.1 Nucleoside-diphosphate-sugar epimerase [Microbulbifer marinus]